MGNCHLMNMYRKVNCIAFCDAMTSTITRLMWLATKNLHTRPGFKANVRELTLCTMKMFTCTPYPFGFSYNLV